MKKVYENQILQLDVDESTQQLYLTVLDKSAKMASFDTVTKENPRVKVGNFKGLKEAFEAPGHQSLIGDFKPLIDLTVSKDEMKCHMTLNLTKSQFEEANQEEILSQAFRLLEEKSISVGIQKEAIESLRPMETVVVAYGIDSIPGEDAKVRYYELGEKKPQVKKDGNVDHYEIHLLDCVQKGDWVGEKIHATEGTPGKTVFGNPIPAKKGRDFPLKFDKKAIDAVESDGVTELKAKIEGAVRFRQGKITVEDHLFISGDVNYKTGNIRFNGHVTIEGTVEDKFTVVAQKDILIKGDIGVGAVDLIHSESGDIAILGGINGKGVAKIKAGRNVYAKFVREASVEAGDDINVGLYAIDSHLKANFITSLENGRIIGGNVDATHRVMAGSIGNRFEKETQIKVSGFSRKKVTEELTVIKSQFSEALTKGNQLKRQLEIFEINQDSLDEKALNTYNALMFQYEKLIDEINELNAELRRLETMLLTRGEGEITVLDNAHPNTMLEIKNLQKKVKSLLSGSIFVKDNEIHLKSE
ncbi:hypothetical protein SAMN05192551_106142 [Tindallia magadiensis]|uniref:Flagellar Assembly Protein A N-terminal region domain-containing protein n=1 Tax=Tindallia magadiensis TaxID=69895 RepID=A0A1I3FG72_9FIRM|nr:FapA family protein [Tindallia magadiensis]SFI09911.1 hypothetical protein SAMN05192551_106142 [Tindallia magadiensis]